MGLYLDASVILPTLVEETTSEVVEQFIRTASNEIVISAFAAAEVSSAICRRLDHTLVTLDQRMALAAAELGVPVHEIA